MSIAADPEFLYLPIYHNHGLLLSELTPAACTAPDFVARQTDNVLASRNVKADHFAGIDSSRKLPIDQNSDVARTANKTSVTRYDYGSVRAGRLS
ncbi:hypothetical protein [Pseudomonas sp. GL-RE-29]|uniref:hypothetical protein n=1 Tax=Pseudomonas sp. GL-RE-29 TaxID=2832375 RepID=UPI001CC0EE17|nr:hypothetical protein [Pseudomonas sp. GL-RE-29]